jgi:hypothetical protein
MTKETISKSPSGRPTRKTVGVQNVLTVSDKDPAFHYRIVNDRGDRVQAFQDAGYEIVKASEVKIGDKRINSATPEGTLAQVAVGGGDKAFLMKQRQEWYKEDQRNKQAAIDAREDTMKQEVAQQGGQFKQERSNKF